MNQNILFVLCSLMCVHTNKAIDINSITRAPRIDAPEQRELGPEKDVSVDGDLFVKNNACIEKDLTVVGNVEVHDDALFRDDVTIEENLIVNGNTTIVENLDVGCNLTVGKTAITSVLEVLEDALINGDLEVFDDAFIGGDLEVSENVFIGDDLTVSGSATIIENLDVGCNLTVEKGLTVSSLDAMEVSIEGNLDVDCNLTVGKTLTTSVLNVLDDTFIGDDLTVSGSVTIAENLDVDCNLTVGKTLTTSVLEVLDDALIGDDLTVSGSVTIAENLDVDCNLTVGKTLTTSVLEVLDNATINNNLDVANCITTSWLEVTDDVLIQDDLTVSGSATIAENLDVDCNLTVAKTATASRIEALCNVVVGCNILMNDSFSSSVGNITKAGIRFMHNAAQSGNAFNTFLGEESGNFSFIGDCNTGIGSDTLVSLESGSDNIAVGVDAGRVLINGDNNIYIGNPGGIPNPVALLDLSDPWDLSNAIDEEDDTIRIGIPQNNGQEVLDAIDEFLSEICNLESELTITDAINDVIDDINAIISPLSIPPVPDIIIDIGFFIEPIQEFLTFLGLCGGDIFPNPPGNPTKTHKAAHMAGIFGVIPDDILTGEGILSQLTVPVSITQFGQLSAGLSSARYKENIKSLSTEKIIQIIEKLRPVMFNYKKHNAKIIEYGLIAEEVEKVARDLVVYDRFGRPEAVRYQFVPILLLHMVQELYQRIQNAQQERNTLIERLALYESTQQVLMSRLDSLDNIDI